MKLLLTSAGMEIKEEILKILPKSADQTTLAHIITAAKVEEDKSYAEEDKNKLVEAGFLVKDIDIEGKNENELMRILSGKDVIYVQGGNTFYLLKYVKESGFDKVVKNLINRGVIYIGVSAGTIIAGRNISSASWKYADKNIVDLRDLTGMELVPYIFSVHIDDTNFDDNKIMAEKAGCPVISLTNEQGFLVDNETQKIVGAGEKYIFNTDAEF
jgi:dipeptidase E